MGLLRTCKEKEKNKKILKQQLSQKRLQQHQEGERRIKTLNIKGPGTVWDTRNKQSNCSVVYTRYCSQ